MRCVLAGVAIVAPSAAQGNVSVLTDGQGNLRVIGDEAGNRLLLMEEIETGDLVLRGLSGTTVNHKPEIRPFFRGTRVHLDMRGGDDFVKFAEFEVGDCCGFEVVFLGGEGDDEFRVGDEQASLQRVDADLGPGNDRFWCGEGGGVRLLTLFCGDGDDVVDGYYSFLWGGVVLDLGKGHDLVDLRDLVARDGLAIRGGPDPDTILFDETYLPDSLDISTEDGDDVVRITGSLEDDGDGGPLFVDAGAGADEILLNGDLDLALGVTVQSGTDADLVTLDALHQAHDLGVSLGTGDDRLRIEGSFFPAAVPVVFDGAEGTDRFVDHGGNHFDAVPDVLRFEGPKARYGRPPPLDVMTALSGRVVEPNGHAVAGAIVTVAELGITVTSGSDGRFHFDELAIPFTRLELTAGATVRGRRMSALVTARPAPETVTEVGDVVLAPTRALMLVFGDDALAVGLFEQQLHGLGNDPLAVVVERFLPQDLTAFEVLWHLPFTAPLTADERTRLAAFVRSGGGLHLSGEGNLVQSAHELLVNELILDPDLDIVGYSGSSFPFVYNPDVVGGLGRWPNALGGVSSFSGGRILSGIEPENAFIVGAFDRTFAGAWTSLDLVGGRGRLTLGLVNFWLYAQANADPVENLQAFLRWEPDAFATR